MAEVETVTQTVEGRTLEESSIPELTELRNERQLKKVTRTSRRCSGTFSC